MNEHRRRLATIAKAVLIALSLSLLSTPAMARDRDGSRVRAKNLKLDQTAKDSLNGASDKSDWRYIELPSGGEIVVKVSASGPVRVTVTDARGKTVKSSPKAVTNHILMVPIQPGIWYIEVASDAAATYTVQVNKK